MYYSNILISGKYSRQLLLKKKGFFLGEFNCVRCNVFNLVDFLFPFAIKFYLKLIIVTNAKY